MSVNVQSKKQPPTLTHSHNVNVCMCADESMNTRKKYERKNDARIGAMLDAKGAIK